MSSISEDIDMDVRRTWVGRTLVVMVASFVNGKCHDIDIKEYNAENMPVDEIRRIVKQNR